MHIVIACLERCRGRGSSFGLGLRIPSQDDGINCKQSFSDSIHTNGQGIPCSPFRQSPFVPHLDLGFRIRVYTSIVHKEDVRPDSPGLGRHDQWPPLGM
jgi:hypothetical protein